MSKKLDIKFIRTEFKKEGYELLTKVYENNKQKLEYICPRGHKHSIVWHHWNSSKKVRCPYCANNVKLTIEFIRAEFEEEGYILLTTVYENAHQKLDYICPMGHKYKVSWDSWNSLGKVRCPYCNGRLIITLEIVRQTMAKENYILLTKVYKNNTQKLYYICPRGHKHCVSWSNWKKGKRCPCFSNLMKPTIEFIRAEFEKEGYILLTKAYKNNRQKLYYVCSEGHRHYMTWDSWQQGRRCSKCSNKVSKWEKAVKNFLGVSNIDYISNNRTQLINPETGRNFELDIWFPELNKAIECNGLYWHSKPDRKECDKIKRQLCKDQGIDLLVITDKEWNDDINKCKDKIQEFLC